MDLQQTDPNAIEAALETSKGTLVVTFLPEKAPLHVSNFLSLAQEGFYDGTAFHRVIRNFMIQGGCPNTKEGATGQPGTGRPEGHDGLRAEFNDVEHRRGVVSMARGRDPNSAGSQFFIVHGEHAPHLDGKYTAFAVVEEGLDVLDEIASVECSFGPNGEQSEPAERIDLLSISLRPRQQRGDAEGGEGEAATPAAESTAAESTAAESTAAESTAAESTAAESSDAAAQEDVRAADADEAGAEPVAEQAAQDDSEASRSAEES
jgi:peptidyl-prolyl cis-trans isomerase B (cyclophilin B)